MSTSKNRISVYNRTAYCVASTGIKMHKFWLQHVLDMDIGNLNKNTLGLDGSEIKSMAQELLSV